ncbi:hypothetical protein B0H13DRAFT_2047037, partial [Mycena leptocephala]
TVSRLEGHSFHRFSDEHEFTKPNDIRALEIMEKYSGFGLAFREFDEFSFPIRNSASLY